MDATRILDVWDGMLWTQQKTNNPAWACWNALTGSQLDTPWPSARLDPDEFKAWADWCDANAIQYNWAHGDDDTILQRANAIARAGHAVLAFSDGMIRVVRDSELVPETQTFTPKNSRDFRAEKSFVDLPHALRVSYIDGTTYEQDEIVVYREGFDETTATRFERMQTVGVTDPDQAWKQAQYLLRHAVLRPETYTLTADFENLIARRGSVVEIANDVILVGLKWGRIKSITEGGTGEALAIELDEELIMETGKTYGVRIRKQDNTRTQEQVTTTPGGGCPARR